jgi:L-alanine-DL-glutamate epimerase-like enolase superfamily enzyme
MTTRREFIKNTPGIAGLSFIPLSIPFETYSPQKKRLLKRKTRMNINQVESNFIREPLIRPFGFKGGYMSEIWQTVARIGSDRGTRKIGLCSQSVLWSDARVFSGHSEAAGNALMYAMTEYGLRLILNQSFSDPIHLLENILDPVYEYGKKITGLNDLRKTFALNALVALDNAAWLLYASENDINSFDEMIPEKYRKALSYQHEIVASIPLMAYSIPVSEIKQAVQDGYFFMKIKIGQPGSQEEMLQKDKKRLSEIHSAIGNERTPYTKNGRIPYYFDANGRYESKETLLRLLEHADKIGALDQITIIEEPFPEDKEIHVEDLGIRIAADESAHTDEDAQIRIEMGYQAIALKAIAKTLSMTLKIADVAHKNNVPCFCADLTVNPILVEWNKNVAARLSPFPDLGLGLLETNGHQNYLNWEKMISHHPYPDASWRKTEKGIFALDDDYYRKSGGIFKPSPFFEKLFQK